MSRVSRVFRHIGTAIKLILTAGIAFVCGLLIWRIFIAQAPPKELDHLYVDDALYEAYEQKGKDLALYTQGQGTITRADRNRGYFSVTQSVMIPDANQIQILFRYNQSTVEALQRDKDLPETPNGGDHLYDVSLVLSIDLTPENKEDNDKAEPGSVQLVRVHPNRELVGAKSLYHYRRLVFDIGSADLDLQSLLDSGLVLAIYADVYYVGDLDYTAQPYGTLCLYDYGRPLKDVKLSGDDKDALKAYQKN